MNESIQKYSYQDEALDLRELWIILWNKKWRIIIFTFIITLASIFYSLRLPNIYKSETLLIPSEQQSGANLGGLSALAGLAGVNIGSGGKISIFDKMTTLKNDYTFTVKIITKYNLLPLLIENFENLQKNDGKFLFLDAYRILSTKVVISEDKKTSLISISSEDKNPELAYKLVNIYLDELSDTIRTQELDNINEKIEYYKREISKVTDASLKEQLSKMASILIQNKILAKANKYYGLDQITKPIIVTDIRNKVRPKRSLIVIVTFVTSLIFAIFFIFFMDIIKSFKNNKKSSL